jgi:hypothetical protein
VDQPQMGQGDAYAPPAPPRARREQDANLSPESEDGNSPPLDAGDLPPRSSVGNAEDQASDRGGQSSGADDQ